MVPRASPEVNHPLRHGIDLFNRGAFFECHEALEEIWTPERGARRIFLQSIIHIAVAFYHVQRGNRLGAERQLRKGLKKMAGYLPECEGVQTEELYREAAEALKRIQRGEEIGEFPKITLR
jgi:predicted metal-dependent hydrolase